MTAAKCKCKHCKLDHITTLLTKQGKILMTLKEDLSTLRGQVDKSRTEFNSRIDSLQQHITALEALVTDNADARAELDAAKEELDGLRASVQLLDDENPDAQPEPQPEPEPTPEPDQPA